MKTILESIVAAKKKELRYKDFIFGSRPPKIPSFKNAIAKQGLSIIAEFKRRSPSSGSIKENIAPSQIASLYESGGAAAISVLTEKNYFSGSDEDLQKFSSIVNLPILRKDFIVDVRQIHESRILGASAVLLIASILKDDLATFIQETKKLNMDALIEVHNFREIDRAIECGADIIGINSRNLNTFAVDFQLFASLKNHIPSHILSVAESGIRSIEDARFVRRLGYDAALIGEFLMKNRNITAVLQQMRDCHDSL
jgi:indole-3-glycerol phosphate synthase